MRIALIDDKAYAIPQIIDALHPWLGQYSFHYFPSYRLAVGEHFDVILLDYYLDIDRVVGRDIIGELDAKTIVGFSSDMHCSEEILRAGGHYAVEKIGNGTTRNDMLQRTFAEIFLQK